MTPIPHSRSFVPTRDAGLARLAAFAPSAGRAYAATRNSDHGPDDRRNVSGLSPYLRHRLVTEDEALKAVLDLHGPAASEKFIQEVLWRAYFKGHMETRPALWTRFTRARDAQLAAIDRGGGFARAYARAVEGRTGIDAFDAWARELVETGYLHNHARMWFASIWIFTLRLPWELGADFTFRHLIDGDPASNTLSWRWVGGLHTRGKTYLARADNIATYTGGRFSPEGLARDAPALEEAEPPPPPSPIPPAAERAPSGPVALLVTEEDLRPETLPGLADAEVTAVAVAPPASRSRLPTGDPAAAFLDGALEDARARVGDAFEVSAQRAPDLSAAALLDVCRAAGVTTLVTAYVPVGPSQDRLAAVEPELRAAGVDVVRLRRPLDDAAWPHATKGFFALKSRIPAILETVGDG